ncbi:hypothetical protein SKAU_G00205110 [Synaphobranchus kaupii]|uniref:Immunoglobulin I-set domain-containing protein n=1 Tax=Synaphobranchus kaupii TaxID=118154 RepID=A0A9Q1FG83_SYNKA|nr:hypothetical protein SKAU_G00205110 [Synaphobranchus kaupii]
MMLISVRADEAARTALAPVAGDPIFPGSGSPTPDRTPGPGWRGFGKAGLLRSIIIITPHPTYRGKGPQIKFCLGLQKLRGAPGWRYRPLTVSDASGSFREWRQGAVNTETQGSPRSDRSMQRTAGQRCGGPVRDLRPATAHHGADGAGRVTVLAGGTLEIRYAQVTDSGTYICIASNAGGNDTYFATLTVRGPPPDGALFANRSLYAADLNDTRPQRHARLLRFTLDLTTILVSTAMGCITFLGVVLFCFLLLFVWSRGRGQRKNNFTVEYTFRKTEGPAATSSSQGGARKFNMKMI